VDLLEIDGDTVRLAFAGSCKSCPSSAVTLELAVEDAVRAAAPEISSIEVVTAAPPAGSSTVIPTESLLAHVRSGGRGATTWHPLPELDELRPGEVAGFLVAGATVVGCRVGEALFAYRDHCPVCDDTLAGAGLHDALLGCPRCHTRFDVVRAGAGPGGAHLEPLPLLPRDGVLSVALGSEAVSEAVSQAVEVPA
jgi:nitrite reductase/ring-hydroxylating ferredoxin subunit